MIVSEPSIKFRTKICGITSVDDARGAVAAGCDAIGLNFYPRSPRSVTAERATAIAGAVSGSAMCVGVFVNESPQSVGELAQLASLDAIQLHGDEPPQLLSELPGGLRVIRAWRLGDDGLEPLVDYLDQAAQAGRVPDAVLIDARVAGLYGGSGATADWNLLTRDRAQLGDTRLILAGGLTPENVAAAVEQVCPDAVDTASGVESSPGAKDRQLVNDFVRNATAAFGRITR